MAGAEQRRLPAGTGQQCDQRLWNQPVAVDGVEMLPTQQAVQRPPLRGDEERHQQPAPRLLLQAGQNAALVGQLLQAVRRIAEPFDLDAGHLLLSPCTRCVGSQQPDIEALGQSPGELQHERGFMVARPTGKGGAEHQNGRPPPNGVSHRALAAGRAVG